MIFCNICSYSIFVNVCWYLKLRFYECCYSCWNAPWSALLWILNSSPFALSVQCKCMDGYIFHIFPLSLSPLWHLAYSWSDHARTYTLTHTYLNHQGPMYVLCIYCSLLLLSRQAFFTFMHFPIFHTFKLLCTKKWK